MLPAIVFPFHDTDGLMFAYLETVTPQLKEIFARAFVSITPPTQQIQAKRIDQLQADKFFTVNFNQPDTLPGDHFLAAYKNAAAHCPSTQVLHLCTIDRVIFALQSGYKEPFIADIKTADNGSLPLLFQRSQKAWHSHPQNYWGIESVATQVGEILFNKSLDFVWCHLVIQTQQLQEILPHIRNHDLSILAEIVLLLKDKIKAKDVDWLSWEDPFIFSRDPEQFKTELENSSQESHKRLKYILPVMQLLLESAKG